MWAVQRRVPDCRRDARGVVSQAPRARPLTTDPQEDIACSADCSPPRIEVSAHCDLPCGVYDPAQARIEAESIKGDHRQGRRQRRPRLPHPRDPHQGAALRAGQAPPVGAVDRLLQAPALREVPAAAHARQRGHQAGRRLAAPRASSTPARPTSCSPRSTRSRRSSGRPRRAERRSLARPTQARPDRPGPVEVSGNRERGPTAVRAVLTRDRSFTPRGEIRVSRGFEVSGLPGVGTRHDDLGAGRGSASRAVRREETARLLKEAAEADGQAASDQHRPGHRPQHRRRPRDRPPLPQPLGPGRGPRAGRLHGAGPGGPEVRRLPGPRLPDLRRADHLRRDQAALPRPRLDDPAAAPGPGDPVQGDPRLPPRRGAAARRRRRPSIAEQLDLPEADVAEALQAEGCFTPGLARRPGDRGRPGRDRPAHRRGRPTSAPSRPG